MDTESGNDDKDGKLLHPSYFTYYYFVTILCVFYV